MFGQTVAPSPASATGSFSGGVSLNWAAFGPPAVASAPYSGEEVSEAVQLRVDGTRITRKMPGQKIYRDFAGRTRTERPAFPAPQMGRVGPASDVLLVVIYDPVAGYQYALDTVHRVAHRVKMQAATSVANAAPQQVRSEIPVTTVTHPPNRYGQTTTVESLGTQVINGMQTEGLRTTMTTPAGAMGNDRPMSSVTETWTSSELKIVIFSNQSDPGSSASTRQILNLSRAEPDPNLFIVPTDYTVVDETGRFSIEYSK